MATYNGERFVVEQLASILPQLGPEDEVVVIDDKSSDSTRELVAGFGDARIRLIDHRERQGVVSSFDHAVRSASGDILFLCDQDDIWAPDK
ncbi:MAG: glycosyltransferase, partial [Terriglobales bacterium]